MVPGFFWAILGALLPVGAYFYGAHVFLPFAFAFVVFAFFIKIMTVRELPGSVEQVTKRSFGVLYVALPLAHLVFFREIPNGSYWTLLALVVIWSNDTFAYYGGRKFGKNKLAPNISPGKTIEGAVSGLIGGVVAALIFDLIYDFGVGFIAIVLTALALGVAGMLGDLAESIMKRGAGVKDSGSLIPGHGGLLDRIDSMLFALPVLYYIVAWKYYFA